KGSSRRIVYRLCFDRLYSNVEFGCYIEIKTKGMIQMIDIHSHILPGVDDGAQTESDSIAMALQAVEEGIETIIATPHNHNGQFKTTREMILSEVDKLNTLFEQEGIPLMVLPGQEKRINGDLLTELKNGELVPLNETKYLFVEFPSGSVPRY